MSRALIGGTFDPITIGHTDIIQRAAAVFDEVVVVMFNNSAKKTKFTIEQRYDMLKLTCDDIKNVTCDISDDMVVRYAEAHDIDVIVKGIRSSADYDYEYQMSVINRKVDTFFIPSRPDHIHVSSTVVREFLRYNADISEYVTESVRKYIEEIIV